MIINFYKYQGTGNDFVILDNRNGAYNKLTQEQIAFLCDRRFGIGADGFMLLNRSDDYDFEMVYFNADGREGSMCGNGGRCLVKFAKDMSVIEEVCRFIATDGPHEAKIDGRGIVSLKMKDVHELHAFEDHFVLDTGSPHYVKKVERLEEVDMVHAGRAIRYNDEYKNKGINVNFIEPETEAQIAVRTYERGVEDETYSCGTGVTAAAIVMAKEKGDYNIKVHTKGGNLSVQFSKTGQGFENIWLCGPAEFVYQGVIEI